MEWLRWYHGAISDPKWPLIARKSKQNIGTVVAVWAAILEHASQDEERGSIDGFDPEAIDALYGYEDGTCKSVVDAMADKKLIVNGCVLSWQKRQPKREREDNSTERVRKFREAKKAASETENSNNNAEETPCNASVTPLKRHETPRTEQNREEKNREERELTLSQDAHAHVDNPSADSKPKLPPGPAPSEYSVEFLQLAEQYPRKDEGLAAAWMAFKAAKAAHAYPGNPIVLPILVAWRVSPQWTDDSGRFIPSFSRWIRERRWEAGPPEDEAAKVAKQVSDMRALREIKKAGGIRQ